MRGRDGLVVLAALAASCVHNPDPRGRSIEQVERDGYGGWIVVDQRGRRPLQGELIELRQDAVAVLTYDEPRTLVYARLQDVTRARVWAFSGGGAGSGIGAWGGLGAASTLSHGAWLVFSLPVWITVTIIAARAVTGSPLYEYPDEPWNSLAKWARFPQGMPVNVTARDLVPPGLRAPPSVHLPAEPTDFPAADALAAARRYAVDHGVQFDDRELQDPRFDANARRWVFTWLQAPGDVLVISVAESGEITVSSAPGSVTGPGLGSGSGP